MSDTSLIALEVHDVSIWEPSRILPLLQKMEHWGYNALVLHQNDLLDACTQLGLTANYGVSDLRLKKVRNNAAWLNLLTERLARFGARLFLEIKEPSYHDYALEQLPERQQQAVILRHIEELSNPEIAGIMDISVEAVESLTARGKRSLATILAKRRDELGYENG